MQILWDNMLDNQYISLSGTTPDSGYYLDDVKNYHLSKITKFSTGPTFVIDLASMPYIPLAYIAICVKGSLGSNITVKSAATTDFSMYYFNQTFNSTYSHRILSKDNLIWWILPINNTAQKRYWQIKMDTFYSGVDIAYINLCSVPLQMPPLDPSIELNYNNTGSVSRSITGQTYGNSGINYFSSGFEFPIITDYARTLNGKTLSTREDILTFWYSNQGIKPFVLIPFEQSLSTIPPLMAIIDDNSLTFSFDRTQGHYKLKFKVTETK